MRTLCPLLISRFLHPGPLHTSFPASPFSSARPKLDRLSQTPICLASSTTDRLPGKEVTKRPVGVCKCVYISMCMGVRVCPCVSANAFFLVHVRVLGALETDNGEKQSPSVMQLPTTKRTKLQACKCVCACLRIHTWHAFCLLHVNFCAPNTCRN